MPPKKVVIIGGGAAGVFTAHFLARSIPGCFEVTLLEQWPDVGGHAHSHDAVEGGVTVHIDGGAQFFSETAQPDYCDFLRYENLFGHVTEHDAGMSVWDNTTGDSLFFVPSDFDGMLVEALANLSDWLNFIQLIYRSVLKYLSMDWSEKFGDWLDAIPFLGSAAEQDEFRNDVVRPLMFQFGLVAPKDIDDLSARFVIWYFVRSLPWLGGSAPFRVYNCDIGPDGILKNLVADMVANYGVAVETSKRVTQITQNGAGYVIKTQDNTTHPADEVVFATNPNVISGLLPAGSTFDAVRNLTAPASMPYVDVSVPICRMPQSAQYLPDQDHTTVSNVIVTRDGSGDAEHYMLSVWFGPLRPQPEAELFTKSWGMPSLDPAAPAHIFHATHHLMVGKPTFMENRDKLLTLHQGQNHLWYAGGWTLDYDAQGSCLKAGRRVAVQLTANCIWDIFSSAFLFSTSPSGMPFDPSAMLSEREIPIREGLPNMFDRLLQRVLYRAEGEPEVKEWIEREFPK